MFTQLPESPKLRAFRSLVLGHAKRKALAEETDSETTRRSEDFLGAASTLFCVRRVQLRF